MDTLKGIGEKINNCSLEDSDKILSLYQSARDLQTQKGMVVWPEFEKDFMEKEINEQRQWKLVINDTIACNWAITFSDKEIPGKFKCFPQLLIVYFNKYLLVLKLYLHHLSAEKTVIVFH